MSARRGHGEGAVYKRARDGRWCATVELPAGEGGTRRRKVVTGRTKADVLTRVDKVRRQVADGLPIADDRRTVAQYLEWWRTTILPGTVKPSTEDSYRIVIASYIVPHVGRRPLTKLTPADVRTMLRALEDAGLSPRTRQYARSVLRRALRHAQDGLVVRNVAAMVDGPASAGTKLDDALTAAQAAAVLSAAAGHRLEALAVLALRLGLRRGELLALRWPDVDLDAGELTVAGTLRRDPQLGLVVDEPKTAAAARTIPLVAGTLEALRDHRVRQVAERLAAGPLWEESGYVFATELGAPTDPRNVLRWWHGRTDAAGLGARRLHASRHTAATLLLDAGVPLEVVSAILGHASLAITADVYARVTQDSKRRALTKLEESLAAIG